MCDGYLTSEGECLPTYLPILETPVQPELPNTGLVADVGWAGLVLLVAGVLAVISKRLERRP